MPESSKRRIVGIYLKAFDEALRCTWPVLILPTLIALALALTGQGRDLVRSTDGSLWAVIVASLIMTVSITSACADVLLNTRNYVGDVLTAHAPSSSLRRLLILLNTKFGNTLTWSDVEREWNEILGDPTTKPHRRLSDFFPEPPPEYEDAPGWGTATSEEFIAATSRFNREFTAAKWMVVVVCWIGLLPIFAVMAPTYRQIWATAAFLAIIFLVGFVLVSVFLYILRAFNVGVKIWMGVVVFSIGALSIYAVTTPTDRPIVAGSVFLIIIFLVVMWTSNIIFAKVFLVEKAEEFSPTLQRRIHLASRILHFGVLGAGLFLLVTAIFPVKVGGLLGSQTVAFLMASVWIAVAGALTRWSRQVIRRRSIPAFSLVLLFMVVVYVTLPLTSSVPAMRCVGDDCTTHQKRPRAPISEWSQEVAAEDREVGVEKKADRPLMILVAAGGGGIRAAYWTALVLSQLQDIVPSLHRRIFAISAVSGGSLGATAYTALVTRGEVPPRCRLEDGSEEQGFAACARAFMRGDFLAPTVAATLSGELLNFPLQYLTGRRLLPGRDEALELAWEAQWRDVLPSDDRRHGNDFAQSFDALWWDGDVRRRTSPALLLNGTSARTGERVVVSNLNVREFLRVDTGCAVNVAEHADLPLSTAVNASARFPYIEPPGKIALNWKDNPNLAGCVRSRPELNPSTGEPSNERRETEALAERDYEVIVDGGYYDNYGAATVLDLLDSLEKHFGGPEVFAKSVRLVLIQITSDPTASFSEAFDAGAVTQNDPLALIREECAKLRKPSSSAPNDPAVGATLYEPLNTLFRARARVGIVFARELRSRTAQLDGHYFHFGLREDVEAPLGWTLSAAAREQIDEFFVDLPETAESDALRLWSKRCNIKKQFDILLPLLDDGL